MKLKQLFKSALFLRIVLLVGLFIVLLIGGFTYKHISNLTNSTNIIVRTYEVNVELEHINSYLSDAESGHRKYTLTKDTAYLEPYLNAREKITNSFLELKELTKVNAIQQDGLLWDYHVSDLKKWESEAGRAYGISSIPRTFLIDREGNIAAVNLRGAAAIEQALKQLL